MIKRVINFFGIRSNSLWQLRNTNRWQKVIESENGVKIKSKGKNSVSDIKVGDAINDEEILVKIFNNDCVNILENSKIEIQLKKSWNMKIIRV